MKWEKTFVNCVSDKALIFRIYKELLQLKKQTKITQGVPALAQW